MLTLKKRTQIKFVYVTVGGKGEINDAQFGNIQPELDIQQSKRVFLE